MISILSRYCICKQINGGKTNDCKASVKPPTAPNVSPKYGANIATKAVQITRNVRTKFLKINRFKDFSGVNWKNLENKK